MTSAEKESIISTVKELELQEICSSTMKQNLLHTHNLEVERNYTTLVDMFPNIDVTYIKEVCENPPFHNIDGDLLVMLINYLVNYENKINISDLTTKTQNYNEMESNMRDQILSEELTFQELKEKERLREETEIVNNELFAKFIEEENMKRQTNILINIFPDADPESLQNFIKMNHNNTNSLDEFVEDKLVNRDYLKRNEYFSQLKKKELINKYITKFNVIEFVNEFPDPFEYFENQERKCVKQNEAISFLSNRYRNNFDASYINQVYRLAKYNLSITDQNLQKYANCQVDIQFNIETNDLTILKEIAFIQNKENIQNYLEFIKKEEDAEMQLLREQQLLFECQCCFEEIKPYVCVECDSGHIFCKPCVIKGTKLAILNGHTRIKCLTQCSNEISLKTLRIILPSDLLEIFLKKCQEYEIDAAKLDDLVTCPFCAFSMELSKEIKIFSCKNPECMKISCRLCKKLNHLPIKCENVMNEHKGRLFIEEEMSDALIRKCNSCSTPFIKIMGCNKMTCIKCGAMMCYICRKSIKQYDHFEKPNGCKTNQDSDAFDREQINLRRVLAVQKILQETPDLKLPTKI